MNFWDGPLADLLRSLDASPAGLKSADIEARRRLHGSNSLAGESRFTTLLAFLRLFANPLVLILLGFSGAWIGNLTALEPYRPYFIGVALVALFFAWRRIWRPAAACQPGDVCALPQVRRSYQVLFGAVALLVLIALGFPYAAALFY